MYKWLLSEKGQKIVDWLVPEIFSFILGISKDAFTGWRGRIKLKKLKYRLKKEIFEKILKKYGNEIFYNDLDSFLSQNNIIRKVIENCTDTSVSQYRSNSAIVTFYIKQFEERYPKYKRYHLEIVNMLQQCFAIIFNTLNQIEDEKVRIVCNVIKEVSGELSFQLEAMDSGIKEINKKLDFLVNNNQSEKIEFSYRSYFEYIARSYPQYPASEYIQREIYLREDKKRKADAISTLMQKKKVLLLGEAGYGKTYEAISVLKKICIDEETEKIIPFYLPLSEYGLLFCSIKDGIRNKVTPFVKGNVDKLIEEWLKSGRAVLILDGIDDIVKEEDRTKFILEVKNISQQYGECYYFITSRINRYHHELDEFNQHYLVGLDRDTIRNKLWEEGITVHIPDNYYQLFANPLFFEAGKTLLRKNLHRDMFNRSILFEELIKLLYGEWNQRKGVTISQPLSYVEVVSILGKLAFETFEQSTYGFFEFEQKIISLLSSHNNIAIIGSVIASGIIKVTERIEFTHKLFKEYCAAYYLFSNYPYRKNKDLYLFLIKKEEWKEVFIFIAGMASNIEIQDEFLDFIMQNDLQLYVECVNAKSDLHEELMSPDYRVLANRYLIQIYKSYIYIVSTYFEPISSKFEPRPGHSYSSELKPIIVGSLSKDGQHLSYWFDFSSQEADEVVIIPESELPSYYKEFERKAIIDRRNFMTFGINLSHTGLEGDGGRKIAIDIIKTQLSNILDKRLLIESDYLLYEKINCQRKKIWELYNVTDINEVKKWIDQEIDKVRERDSNIEGYSYNNVDLFELQELIDQLKYRVSDFDEIKLPEPDVKPEEVRRTWDLYSDNQKERRIEKYFYFHQLSYNYMVEKNFSGLCNKFSRYLDEPYQMVVFVECKKGVGANGFGPDPGLHYYYIPATGDAPMKPDIRKTDDKVLHTVMQEHMQRSYLQNGRKLHRSISTSTGFFTIAGESSLSKHVYYSIEESLEEIFGDIR